MGHQKWLEQRINAARDTRLAEDEFAELMTRLSLASATKESVRNRLKVEAQAVGENEWALTQALTWLGSYDRHIMTWSKQQLTSLGTELLENSLTKVLAVESRPSGDGRFWMYAP